MSVVIEKQPFKNFLYILKLGICPGEISENYRLLQPASLQLYFSITLQQIFSYNFSNFSKQLVFKTRIGNCSYYLQPFLHKKCDVFGILVKLKSYLTLNLLLTNYGFYVERDLGNLTRKSNYMYMVPFLSLPNWLFKSTLRFNHFSTKNAFQASARRCISYRNQLFVLLCKTNNWFLFKL